jgi:hypothetical protein
LEIDHFNNSISNLLNFKEKKMKKQILFLLVLLITLAACQSAAETANTPVAEVVQATEIAPTETAVPPTDTPEPTAIPTETAVPTDTPEPTAVSDPKTLTYLTYHGSRASGIAEALIATAMGLFAAIPAVLAYNKFAARAEALLNNYQTFAEEFSAILHRQVHSK